MSGKKSAETLFHVVVGTGHHAVASCQADEMCMLDVAVLWSGRNGFPMVKDEWFCVKVLN